MIAEATLLRTPGVSVFGDWFQLRLVYNRGAAFGLHVGPYSRWVFFAVAVLEPEIMSRAVNSGFSGGEKKRNEIFQMAVLEPKLAILDETDSGLDIDALKIVASGVKELVGPEMGALVITHYQRILNYVKPDFVHVFVDGRIVAEGGPELAEQLEAEGYDPFVPATAGSEAA